MKRHVARNNNFYIIQSTDPIAVVLPFVLQIFSFELHCWKGPPVLLKNCYFIKIVFALKRFIRMTTIYLICTSFTESCFESRLIGETHCISSVNVSDYTEDFEDSSSLAKWSSLDLLAEGEDMTVRTPPAANEQGALKRFPCNYQNIAELSHSVY